MNIADIQEANEFLACNPDIELIEMFIVGSSGSPRGKLLHREELLPLYRQGRAVPGSILAQTITGEDVPETGLVWEEGDADYFVFPIKNSLARQIWRKKPTAQVQVSMHPQYGGSAIAGDPRHVLARVIERFHHLGLTPVVAAELEFYLIDGQRDAMGNVQPATFAVGNRPEMTQVYSIHELEMIQPFLDDLYDACKAQDIPLRTAISEYAPGQVEFSLAHLDDALLAIDNAISYKRIAKGVALKHGMRACFMAKPFGDLAGNGLHMHVSLNDQHGQNIFAAEEPTGTPELKWAIGGMLATMSDLVAVFCPNANSFRRFRANSFAPLSLTWGVNNRTVSLRIPSGSAKSRHIEHRVCGADANLYLVAAGVLAGIYKGITEQIEPGVMVTGNAYTQKYPKISTDWHSAIKRFKKSTFNQDAFGKEFVHIYSAIKRAEYDKFMSEVSEKDWRWCGSEA